MAPLKARKPFAGKRETPPAEAPADKQGASPAAAEEDAQMAPQPGARVDAQAGPSTEVPRSDKTLRHDTQEAEAAKVIDKVVAKEKLDMVDPVASLAQDISEEVTDFPTEILSILGNKIKEHFHSYTGKKLLTTTMSITIASSLFNILKDIYVACKANTPGAKTLCVLGIIASLCGMAASIATICHLHNCDFDLQAAMVHIKDVVKPSLEGPEPCAGASQWDKWKAWIPKIITFLATAIAAGLCFLPKGSAVDTLIKNYGNSKKIGEDVSAMMTSFLTDVVGISLEGDPAYVDALTKLNAEGVELLTTPMHRFHIDTKKRSKLVTYPTRVDEATLHRTNNDTFKTLRMTLQSLQATRNQVVQRVQELFDCSQRTLRQEPVGIYLSGMGGIGKSYFAKELAQELHKECGYPEDIYCIDKCDQNFYEPYKGEATGIANEFMGRRAENEPLLRDINKICSEDYFNFEGAALHTKNQPCHLKAVLVTSNVKNPDLTKVQEPSVTAAMWSRFRRFEVMDPRFSSAEEARTNPQNLERGSQFLIFKEYVTDLNRNLTEIKEWTAQEVKNYVVKECRRRERAYLSKIIQSDPYKLDEQGKKEIQGRIAILEGLVPCAKDGRVFIVRLEGPPGTGKTHFLEKCLVPSISNTFPALTLHRWSVAAPLPKDGKPYLVVVDDSLDDAEKEYFDMVRSISNRSIIIIATNTTTTPTSTWTSATVGRLPLIGGAFRWSPAVEVKSIPGVPAGFWRRVGISDRIRIGATEFEPYAGDCAHFRFYNGYIIMRDGKQLALEAVEEEILDKYIAFLQDAGDFIWSERRLNIDDPTVKIIARSYKDMVEVLSGSVGMAALVKCFARSGTSKPDPRMQIFLDPAFLQQVSNKVGTEEWRVPDRPLTGRTRLQIAEKISAFLRRLKPDATVVVEITNPGLDDEGQSTDPHLYELKGSMGYYTQSATCAPKAQVTYDQQGVRIHATNEVVSYTECAMIEADHDLPNCYKPATIRIIKQSTLDHPQVKHAKMMYNRTHNLKKEMLTEKVLSFFKHPAVIACLSIVGALALAGIIFGIYKACAAACSDTDDEEEMSPCDDSADSRDGTQRKAAAQALRKGTPPKNTKQQKKAFSLEPETRTQQEIDDWTNNYWFSLPGVTPYQEEFKNLSPGARQILKELADKSSVSPATVTPDMELKPHVDPRLSKLMDKICHNLVTVCGHGNNYGLVFEGDILVTTGHTVAGLTDVRVRSKEFTGTARVLKVSVPRDLAVLQLLKTDAGRRAPQFPSLRKYFLASLTQIDKMAWFVKPFTRNTVYVCGKMVTTPSYKCFSSHLSETFNPSEWIVTFFQYRMPWNPTLFQPGECGLPLFVEINGEYKICGIFNGACQNQNVIFASVTASDFNNTQGIVPSTFKTCAQIEYQSEAAGVPHFTANSFVIECLDAISYGNVTHTEAGYPQPIGHCTKLRAHSYPKHKALPLVPNNISAPGGLDNTQRLSCISESLCPDIEVPRRTKFVDGKRVPHSKEPLFLQIQKYGKAPGFTADRELFAKAISEVIHSYKLRIQKSTPLALLSIKQCLNGVRGGTLAGFPRDTGAGPTLRSKFNVMVKRDVLHQVREDPPIHVLADNAAGRWVQNEVSEKLTSILNGVPVVMLTRACKKVEKIDRESWEQAKVRLFTECDFADNILLKILFGEMQSVLASAEGTPLLLNMNPYTMPNVVAEIMGHNLENLTGTDIKSMDKHFPRELIIAFVQVAGALYGWALPVQRAIAATLMFPLQNFEGDVFISPFGNLSGWFPTTLLNCVAQELIIAYDRLKNLVSPELPIFDILTAFAEPYAILGDDKTQRLTKGRAIAQAKSYLECGFIMQAGSKLQEKEERFCSRTLYKEDGKYYGALKLSAISGLIYYASSSELEAITPNFSLALFEAALHKDPSVYEKALISIKFVAAHNDMKLSELASRERYRELYDQYCSGLATVLNFCGHRPDILSILEHCKMGDNARMALNQYAQQTKQAPPSTQARMEGPAHSPKWTVDLTFAGKTYVGTGESKSAAAEVAAKAALEQVRVTPTMDSSEKIVGMNKTMTTIEATPSGHRIEVSRIENDIFRFETVLYRKDLKAAKRAAKHPGEQRILDLLVAAHLDFARKVGGRVCVWIDYKVAPPLKDHVHDGVRYKTDEEGTVYVLSVVMQQLTYSVVVGSLVQEGCTPAPEDHRIFYTPIEGPCMANDTPIQPENVQQATMNTGALTIPQMSNPQPSGQAPSLAPPAEKVVSALEGIQTETLNPLGPPNMLAVGAVCFDLKDLVYSQYMDCDQQFIITDDTPAGSVLLQIPYDPLGEWVNPYIRQYVGQHERYTGTLMFRITIVGNPTFSGLVGVAWQPRRVTTSTINVSEMQKFSYYGVTVELPSNKVIALNDARQNLFWRSTLDVSDVDSRPHLVIFSLMSLVSPLREGIQTRLRIASKLSNGGVDDGIGRNAFQVSLPAIFPNTTSSTRTAVSAQATRLADLVPEFSGREVYMCTDGTAFSGNSTTERGDTLDPESRTYGGVQDQNKLFNQIPRSTDNNQDFGIEGVGQDYLPDPLRQGFNTFSLVLPPSPATMGTTAEGPQTIVAWYETNNLPVELYEKLVARIFSRVEGPATPTEVFDAFISRISLANTMVDLDLLAIFAGQEVAAPDNNEFAPPATMIQSVNWPLTLPTSQTRYGYAITTSHTTSYRGLKLVFRQGMMILYQVTTTARVSTGSNASRGPTAVSLNNIPSEARSTHTCSNNYLWQLAVPMPLKKNFPPWLVEAQASIASASQLPAGWAKISISPVVPSVVLPTIFSTTMLSSSALEKALARRAIGISPTQCLAFDIVDPISNRRVCSARYLPESGDIVCSVPTTAQQNIYATYPANISEALLNNFGPIERSNAFPVTDTTNWLSRKSTASLSHFKKTPPKVPSDLLDLAFGLPRISDIVPHASMAAMMAMQMGGGMLSGIGSGLSSIANQRHEMALQQNKFGHESNMLDKSHGYNMERDSQSHSFNLERDSQNHMFELERMLENFGYTNQLQAQQFQHNSDMSRQNFQQQQSLMFASAPSRALIGGSTRGQSFA